MPPKRPASVLNTSELTSEQKATRKRVLVLPNGEELKLESVNENGQVRAVVIAAMKARIIQLEDELETHTQPAKRARKAPAAPPPLPVFDASAMPQAAGTSSVQASKAEEKKRKIQLKRIFDRLKKECKADTVKFQGSPKQIKFEEVLEFDEFQAIFGGKGVLIQPTPQNKPNSTVTIIEFGSPAAVQDVFGDELKALKGNRWTIGGGRTFAKSVKLGPCDVTILSLEVNYSRNGMKCALKFEVEDPDGHDTDLLGPSHRRSFGGGGLGGLFF